MVPALISMQSCEQSDSEYESHRISQRKEIPLSFIKVRDERIEKFLKGFFVKDALTTDFGTSKNQQKTLSWSGLNDAPMVSFSSEWKPYVKKNQTGAHRV